MDHKEVEEYILSMPNARLDYPFGEGVAVYKVGDKITIVLTEADKTAARLTLSLPGYKDAPQRPGFGRKDSFERGGERREGGFKGKREGGFRKRDDDRGGRGGFRKRDDDRGGERGDKPVGALRL